MAYNFDEIIPRAGTDSFKYDYRKEYFGTNDVIPMWVADMDFKTPHFVLEAIRKRTEHEILGYPVRSDGFYQSAIDWFRNRQGWEISKEWMVFTPGVVPALNFAVNAFSDRGDKIIIQPPVYHPFSHVIKGNGRKVLENPLKQVNGRYRMDLDQLAGKLDKDVKMILISHPHNPVGRVWQKEELTDLATICIENKIIMISDEIHSDLILPGHRHIPIAGLSEEIAGITVTCLAPSKTFNLAGMSTSLAVVSDEGLRKRFSHQLERAHLWTGNIFGNIALETAYRHGDDWLDQLLVYLSGNVDFLRSFLEKELPQVKLIEPEATYLLWLDMSALGMTDDGLKQFMIEKAGLGCNDGPGFGTGGSGFQRMNVACPRSVLVRALNQLKQAVDQLQAD
jgi:cystathionine beta-lyase